MIHNNRLWQLAVVLAACLVAPAASAQTTGQPSSTARTPTRATGTVTYRSYRGTAPRAGYQSDPYRSYRPYRSYDRYRRYGVVPPTVPYAAPTGTTGLPAHVLNPNLPVQPNYGGGYQAPVQPHYGHVAPGIPGTPVYPNVQPYYAPGVSPQYPAGAQPGMTAPYPGMPTAPGYPGAYPSPGAAPQGPGSLRVQNQTGDVLDIVIGGRTVGKVYPNGEQTFTGLATGRQVVAAMTAQGTARFRSSVEVPPTGQGFWTIRKITPSSSAVPGSGTPTSTYPQAQPGAYPQPTQPGAYPQPTQPGAYPQPTQPGAYPQATQPGAYPPAGQPAAIPPAAGATTPTTAAPPAGTQVPQPNQAFPPDEKSAATPSK